MQQPVTRVLTRARALLFCHSFSSRRQSGLYTSGLQSRVRIVKDHLHDFSFSRHFSSRNSGFPNPPSGPLSRLRCVTIDNGRKAGLIVGLVTAAGYLTRTEGLAEILHCDNDGSRDASSDETAEWDYRRSQLGRAVRKLWVPSLCVLTISLSWQHPLSLLVNLLFLMWTTKPSPSSIYLWVEQMRQQDALRTRGLDRGLDRMRAQAAGVMHVEVRDNILFCLARVTSLTKRSTLLGLFGDWWVVSSSSSAIHTGVKLRNFIPIGGPFTREHQQYN